MTQTHCVDNSQPFFIIALRIVDELAGKYVTGQSHTNSITWKVWNEKEKLMHIKAYYSSINISTLVFGTTWVLFISHQSRLITHFFHSCHLYAINLIPFGRIIPLFVHCPIWPFEHIYSHSTILLYHLECFNWINEFI